MRRELRFFDILCLGLNSIIGSGIFLFPGLLAGHLGPASLLVFPVTGLCLVPVAWCYSALASRYEATGGPYLYVRDAFGPWAGFCVGWMCWVTSVVSYAAVANAISVYLGHFWEPMSSGLAVKLVAGGVISVLGVLNYIGVKPAVRTADAFTIAKLIPLFLFVAAGLFSVEWKNLEPWAPRGFSGLGPAVFMAFFALQGFENVPVPAGEARQAERDVPLATIGSLLGAAVFYTVIQFVAMGTYSGLAGSKKPLAEAAQIFLGPGAAIIAAGAAISTIGYSAGSAFGGPRYLFALGTGFLPADLTASHPRFETPYRAIALHTMIALVLAIALDFGKLVDVANVTVALQYAATCAAALKLLRSSQNGAWKLPLGPALPLVGIAATLYLSSQASFKEVGAAGIALAIGVAIALAFKALLRFA